MYKHTFYYFLGNKKYPEIYILQFSTPFDHFQILPTLAVNPNLILEPCHMNMRTFVTILSRKAQCNFPKMRGGGQKQFGTFPKIHSIC